MPRKANFFNSDYMSRKELEQYFTAIKGDLDSFRKEVYERFNKQDEILKTVLNIVQSYNEERKEVKSTLWEFDRRLLKLERKLA